MNQGQLKLNSIHKKGFGLLEIIISIVIVGIIGSSLVQLGLVSLSLSQRSNDKTQAGFILQESVAAVKMLRNESWDANIAILSAETDYYLVWDETSYSLTDTPQPLINNRYKRTIVFSNVLRNAQNDIDVSGTNDALTKKVTVSVEWPYKGGVKNEQVEFYIMNLFST